MADGFLGVDRAARLSEARARAQATPLAEFQLADISLFTSDTHWPWFERRLRSNFLKGYESMPVRIGG
jgi:hypothetical protein